MNSTAYEKAYLEVIKFDRANKCSRNNKNCGKVCVPKKYKCRSKEKASRESKIRNLKSSSIDSSSKALKVVESYEEKIRNDSYETAIAVDPQGNVLVNNKGGVDYVDFSTADMKKMTGKDVILTHNHPNADNLPDSDPRSKGLSFSEMDIFTASKIQAKEVRAVSSGYTHSLKPSPEDGWDVEYWDKILGPVYKKHEREVYSQYSRRVFWGTMSYEKAGVNFHHEVIKRTAKQLNLQYSRTKVKRK